jgi:hypothetical protein
MSIVNQIKAAIVRALGVFAQRQAKHQARGMAREARGYLEGARRMARTNPVGLAALVSLGVGVVWLGLRSRSD